MKSLARVTVGLLVMVLGGDAKANLLTNPGFEFGSSMPFFWNTWGDGEYIWQSGGAHSGSRCMNLGGSDFALMYQRVSGSVGQGYTLSVWAKLGSGDSGGQVKLEFHNSSEVKIVEYSQLFGATTSWTEYTLANVAPPGTAYVTATVVGLAGGTVLFDDISITERVEDPDLVIDVHSTMHVFDGFGAQTWDSSADATRVYNELNIQYVRVSSTSAAVYADSMGINVMFIRWTAPSQWVDGDNELMTQYVDDYAVYWADTVAGLAAGGLRPPYIELSNEPDGDWNTYISPANYNTLVKLTRAELDARGLSDVGIVGPSLSNLDWDNHNSTWIGALDATAVASLAAWGSHAWDDGGLCSGGASCMESAWEDFGDSADAKDPTLPKLISEFATKEDTFHGVVYPHPDSYRDYSASNSMPYAARTYENALALINSGTRVPFVWQATDQSWEPKGWGLIDLSGDPKPVYYALRTLWPSVPVGSYVLELGDQSASVAYGGAFVDDDRLVIGLANDSDTEIEKTIRISGVVGVQVIEAPACVIDHQGDPAIEDPDTAQVIYRTLTVNPDNSFDVTLPGDSTLAIVCDLLFAVDDLDHDGDVDSADYAIFQTCLAGPDVTTAPGGCSAEWFERSDIDADQDVDLGDFAVFAASFSD